MSIRKDLKILKDLKAIEKEAVSLGMKMRRETNVYLLELADRQRRGLVGDAAISHYNEWMHRYGMDHLMVTL